MSAPTPAVPASILATLIALRDDHQRIEPHHADLCPLCKKADAAIAEARAK